MAAGINKVRDWVGVSLTGQGLGGRIAHRSAAGWAYRSQVRGWVSVSLTGSKRVGGMSRGALTVEDPEMGVRSDLFLCQRQTCRVVPQYAATAEHTVTIPNTDAASKL